MENQKKTHLICVVLLLLLYSTQYSSCLEITTSSSVKHLRSHVAADEENVEDSSEQTTSEYLEEIVNQPVSKIVDVSEKPYNLHAKIDHADQNQSDERKKLNQTKDQTHALKQNTVSNILENVRQLMIEETPQDTKIVNSVETYTRPKENNDKPSKTLEMSLKTEQNVSDNKTDAREVTKIKLDSKYESRRSKQQHHTSDNLKQKLNSELLPDHEKAHKKEYTMTIVKKPKENEMKSSYFNKDEIAKSSEHTSNLIQEEPITESSDVVFILDKALSTSKSPIGSSNSKHGVEVTMKPTQRLIPNIPNSNTVTTTVETTAGQSITAKKTKSDTNEYIDILNKNSTNDAEFFKDVPALQKITKDINYLLKQIESSEKQTEPADVQDLALKVESLAEKVEHNEDRDDITPEEIQLINKEIDAKSKPSTLPQPLQSISNKHLGTSSQTTTPKPSNTNINPSTLENIPKGPKAHINKEKITEQIYNLLRNQKFLDQTNDELMRSLIQFLIETLARNSNVNRNQSLHNTQPLNKGNNHVPAIQNKTPVIENETQAEPKDVIQKEQELDELDEESNSLLKEIDNIGVVPDAVTKAAPMRNQTQSAEDVTHPEEKLLKQVAVALDDKNLTEQNLTASMNGPVKSAQKQMAQSTESHKLDANTNKEKGHKGHHVWSVTKIIISLIELIGGVCLISGLCVLIWCIASMRRKTNDKKNCGEETLPYYSNNNGKETDSPTDKNDDKSPLLQAEGGSSGMTLDIEKPGLVRYNGSEMPRLSDSSNAQTGRDGTSNAFSSEHSMQVPQEKDSIRSGFDLGTASVNKFRQNSEHFVKKSSSIESERSGMDEEYEMFP